MGFAPFLATPFFAWRRAKCLAVFSVRIFHTFGDNPQRSHYCWGRTYFTLKHFCGSISGSWYLAIFSASFRAVFLYTGTAMSITWRSLVFSLCETMSGLLCSMFQSVSTYVSHNTLISCLVVISQSLSARKTPTIPILPYSSLGVCSGACTYIYGFACLDTVFRTTFYGPIRCGVLFGLLFCIICTFRPFHLPRFCSRWLVAGVCFRAAHGRLLVSNLDAGMFCHLSDRSVSTFGGSAISSKWFPWSFVLDHLLLRSSSMLSNVSAFLGSGYST